MAKIITIGAMSKDKLKTHKMEILVEFDEPVTQGEAENVVLEAIGDVLYNLNRGGDKK